MSDPGTCLAIVSLALQVSKGLLGYYDIWTHADEDIAEIQRSLLGLANIFTQLEITLGKPNLSQDIISIVRITMKGCDSNVKKLEDMLEKVKREGAPEKLRTKFKNFNRRMLQMFQHGEIMRVQSVLNDLREDLNMTVNLLSLNTTATSLDDLRKVHADLTTLQNSNTERIEMEKEKNREARRCALIEWLAAPNVAAAHLSAQDQREEGTGGWFLESKKFLVWLNAGQSMWLAGDVGCGKTVLCSSIIEYLKVKAPERGDRITYFYFTFNDISCHSATGFLRSMLRQLCLTDPIDPLIETLYQRCGPDPPSTKQMQATLLAHLARACVLDDNADLAQSPRVYMILDGVDEIPYGPDRIALLLLLHQMAEKVYPLLNILVSSRPERDIEKEISRRQQWRKFTYSSGGARDDLGIYVANQIKLSPKLASLPDHTKEDIQQKLVADSGGMFRWTSLQMQELKKKRILRGRDVQRILSSLPQSLDATYERALLQIDSDFLYEAKTALQWLSCCIRPLYLEELVDASIINPDEEVPFSEDSRISPFDLVDLLPGLIKVNPPPDSSETMFLPKHYTVTLAHFSVKEYLVSSRILDSLSFHYAVNLELAHRHVVRSSLAYIGHCLSAGSSYPHDQSQVDDFPLQLYAYSRWEMHAQRLSEDLGQVWACVLETFKQPPAALMWRASTYLSRKLREESAVYHLDIPFEAFSSPDWPTHYLLCRAVVSGNESLVHATLESGLHLADMTHLGNAFRLALLYCAGSRARDMSRSQNDSFAARPLSSSGGDSIPHMLMEFGYQPKASDLLLATRHGSIALLSLMIEKAEGILFSDIMNGLDQAVTLGRFQIAGILLQQLLLGTHSHIDKTFCTEIEAKKAAFEVILLSAIKRLSSNLVAFLMDTLPDGLVNQLDLRSLFLRAIVDTCHFDALALQLEYTQISKKTRESAERWEMAIASDALSFTRLRGLNRPYLLSSNSEAFERVLYVWLELGDSFKPQNRFIETRMLLNAKISDFASSSATAKPVVSPFLDNRFYTSINMKESESLVFPRPVFNGGGLSYPYSLIKWFVFQLRGLAEGLRLLHNEHLREGVV